MKKRHKFIKLAALLALCAIPGLLAALAADVILAWRGSPMPEKLLPVLAVALTAATAVLLRKSLRRAGKTVALAILISAAAVAAALGCWYGFSANAVSQAPAQGKEQIYAGRNVMVVVPHQDDEFNILGGVFEEYSRYGSQMSVVFLTNGDFVVPAQTRFSEAADALQTMGVSKDNIIFLGYGNEWQPDGPHLYNGEPEQTLTSYAGFTQTYGAEGFNLWQEGKSYTAEHLMEDLEAVILEKRPDVIFCSDYDHHADHRAASLFFDKVMGRILRSQPDYRPVIYKAYAYSTAWEAEADFYQGNMLSTRDIFQGDAPQQPAVYRWEDRVRLPIDPEGVSRSVFTTSGYHTLSRYASQGADSVAVRILNGDKVFWQRHTDSLCYDARITAGAPGGELLKDFMLIDNLDLMDPSRQPWDGVWLCGEEEAGRSLEVAFPEKRNVACIVLYDHPSADENILDAVITFPDGTKVHTGALDAGGAATVVPVEKSAAAGFTLTVTQWEGSTPGLTEVEAFASMPDSEGRFLKIMDAGGNFLYDHRLPEEGREDLRLYFHGKAPEEITVSVSDPACGAQLSGDTLTVTCPAGKSCVVAVSGAEPGMADSILVRNPGKLSRMWEDFWRNAEAAVYLPYCEGAIRETAAYRLMEKIMYVLRHI